MLAPSSRPGRALAASFCLCAALLSQAKPKEKETVYAKDVAYLLDELEKVAGKLLKQKGVDWNKVRAEFSKLVKDVKDDVAHVKLCHRLLARLRDGHAGFTKVEVKVPQEPPHFGCGVTLCEQGDSVLIKTCRDSAAKQGLWSGMTVLEIDGKKAPVWIGETAARLADLQGFSTQHAARYAACHWGLSGADGTKFKLVVAGDNASKREVTLETSSKHGAARFVGPLFANPKLETIGRRNRDAFGMLESGYGYIYLGECAEDLASELDTALEKLTQAKGLILDLRANNGGGTDHASVFGRFLAEGAKWRDYTGQGKAPFSGPMVVIVDAGTRSTGETISGQFKEDGRAYMIGPEPTAGMSAQKQEREVPSKLFKVRFAEYSNKQRFQGGKGIEGIGVAPNEVVPWDAKLMKQGIDPMVRKAEELLKNGFPKGAVPYEPPAVAKK